MKYIKYISILLCYILSMLALRIYDVRECKTLTEDCVEQVQDLREENLDLLQALTDAVSDSTR